MRLGKLFFRLGVFVFCLGECLEQGRNRCAIFCGCIAGIVSSVIENGGVKHMTYNNHYYGEVPRLPDALHGPGRILAGQTQCGRHGGQPLGLTGEQKGLLASEVAEQLGIRSQWMLFGKLWKEKPVARLPFPVSIFFIWMKRSCLPI